MSATYVTVYLRDTSRVVTTTDYVSAFSGDVTIGGMPEKWADLVVQLIEAATFDADQLADIVAAAQDERLALYTPPDPADGPLRIRNRQIDRGGAA